MTQTTPPPPSDRKVNFTAQHLPTILSGNYRLQVTQSVQVQDHVAGQAAADTYQVDQAFTVSGDRWQVPPQHIRNVFPPNGSLGDHSNVLPHLMFNRTTLPWERLPQALADGQAEPEGHDRAPWLALLLVDEDDPRAIESTQTLQDLRSLAERGTQSSPFFTMRGFELEFGKDPKADVQVVDIPHELVRRICPERKDLYYCAHVRQVVDHEGEQEAEFSCITGTRLPKPGKTSTVYLVSLENRYDGDSLIDIGLAQGDDLIRFVCLKKWSFTCKTRSHNFDGLLKALNTTPVHLALPDAGSHQIAGAIADGFVPLEHVRRDGRREAALYRGPFVPVDQGSGSTVPKVAHSDALLARHPSGLLDTSLAAAWEAGRMLTLQRRAIARALFTWKRTHIQASKGQAHRVAHLPFRGVAPDGDLPGNVATWFQDLAVLKHVPANYLIPNEDMLPKESLRLFTLDPTWIEALLEGAYSVGRLTRADLAHAPARVPVAPKATISGVLLRSDAVAGWPHLQIKAYAGRHANTDYIAQAPLKQLRFGHLSDHIALLLVEGEIGTIDVGQKPEALHFGFDLTDQGTGAIGDLYRKRRGSDGTEEGTELPLAPGGMSPKGKDDRVLSPSRYEPFLRPSSASAQALDGGAYALQMVVGVQSVRFLGP